MPDETPDESENAETPAVTYHIRHNPDTAEVYGGTQLPSGWVRCADTPDGKKAYRRRAVYRGPASSLEEADAAVRKIHSGVTLDVSHSRPIGSAVAEVTVSYTSRVGTAGGESDDDDEDEDVQVAPDTVTLTPQTVAVALAAHPMFAGKAAKIVEIESFLAGHNVGAALGVAGDDDALKRYVAMWYAGIRTWNTPGYTLTTVRHFAPDANKNNFVAGLLAKTGSVMANWNAVEGAGSLPAEPMWTDTSSSPAAARSFEWLLCGASPMVTNGELQVTIIYQAAWKWCADLYPGGSWTPPVPTAS